MYTVLKYSGFVHIQGAYSYFQVIIETSDHNKIRCIGTLDVGGNDSPECLWYVDL